MRISIVLPALNEVENIPPLLKRIRNAMQEREWDYDIVVVDDGSTDGTSEAVREVPDYNRIKVIRHPINRGYGAALRSGFSNAYGEWVFLTDSDGQFDIEQIDMLAAHTADSDIVIGYRVNRQDHVGRKLNTALFHMAISLLFGLKIRDIDCAFKLIRRSTLDKISLTANGALINTELLIGARKVGARITEVPVTHLPRCHGSPTGARLGVILKAIRELTVLRIIGRAVPH